MELMRGLNEQGTTIIQVTHDERVAGFSRRVIELADGWLSADREKIHVNETQARSEAS
jgi:ABC-type lipoprotein export system ATPase subunit